ncbi:HNH endonuclease [Nocardia rhizosphaerae]|uniref:HNH endonuclease n=1 Tax=Nocardia rhizosphaerae TaxID=1691571 RepID=A0ABV8L2I8_9NOCA
MRRNEKRTRRIVKHRAGDLCERCGMVFGQSAHHRKNRGQGGEWSPTNIVWLCGDGVAGCHGWVTAHPADARTTGFHVPWWEEPAEIPIRSLLHGVVLLADDGTVTCYPDAEEANR